MNRNAPLGSNELAINDPSTLKSGHIPRNRRGAIIFRDVNIADIYATFVL